MVNCFKKMLKDESGATAIEYGLLAGLVAVAIISSVTALGTKLSGTFEKVSTSLSKINTEQK